MTRLTEIAGRLAKATEGPWKARYFTEYCHKESQALGGGLYVLTGPTPCRIRHEDDCRGHENQNWSELEIKGPWRYRPTPDGREYISSNDADFIAHARTDIPYLLQRVERLEGVVGKLPHAEGAVSAREYEDGWAVMHHNGQAIWLCGLPKDYADAFAALLQLRHALAADRQEG